MRIHKLAQILSVLSITIMSFKVMADGTPFQLQCTVQSGGNLLTASFDSSQPALTVSDTLVDGTHGVTQFLSPASVCGIAINFATNCTGTNSSGPSNSPDQSNEEVFQFQCTGGISGSLTYDGNSANFSCSGPGVTSDYQMAVFSGCTLTR